MIRAHEAIAAGAFVAALLAYGAYTDRQMLEQIDAGYQLRAEGVCGTGGELAHLSDGFACLHETPEGRLVARPVFDSPTQLAGQSAGY